MECGSLLLLQLSVIAQTNLLLLIFCSGIGELFHIAKLSDFTSAAYKYAPTIVAVLMQIFCQTNAKYEITKCSFKEALATPY